MKRVLFAVILIFVFSAGAGAETGRELFERAQENCAQGGAACISLHKKAASVAWIPSMRALGNIYLRGEVFRENIGKYAAWYDFAVQRLGAFYTGNVLEAAAWFLLAADEYGDPVSAYALGNMYSYGFLSDDKSSPDFWYKKAASADYTPALYALGDMALKKQDYDLAVRYFATASAAGDAKAAYMVGVIYYEGLGVEPNFDLALEQFNLASERGNKSAAKMLKKINEEME